MTLQTRSARCFFLVKGLLLLVMAISCAIPNLAPAATDELQIHGIDLYFDKDGGADACASGINFGSFILRQENYEVFFLWDAQFIFWNREYLSVGGDGWYHVVPEMASQMKDPKSTYCARLVRVWCGIDDEHRYIPCDSEHSQKIRGVLTYNGFPSLRVTVKGLDATVEPRQACCSSDGKFKEMVLWESQSCPAGTTSAGKSSIKWDCDAEVRGQPSAGQTGFPSRESKGRCCLPTGCEAISPIDCLLLHGKPVQPGQPCSGDSAAVCPDLTGACITGEGCKEPVTGSYCAQALSGRYLGDGSQCPPPEPPPSGCCLPEGCKTMQPQECGLLGGEPMPAGQQCSGDDVADCANLTGACIVGEKCEPAQTEYTCQQVLSGTYLGNGRTCPPQESDKRACCAPGGCSLETEESCRAMENGVFMADMTTCEPDACPKPEAPRGGCCDGSGECEEDVAEDDCAENKTFFAGGCPATCPLVWGACYTPCDTPIMGNDCKIMSWMECKSISGSPFLPGGECMGTDCPGCENCPAAFGTWTFELPDESAEVKLNPDCSGSMVTDRQPDDRVLPVGNRYRRTMTGTWECRDGHVINARWAEFESVFYLVREGGALKLCYKDGETLICTEGSAGISVIVKEIKKARPEP